MATWLLTDKTEPAILERPLPERIKNDFMQAKRVDTTIYIPVKVKDSSDLENVKKLIDPKIRK